MSDPEALEQVSGRTARVRHRKHLRSNWKVTKKWLTTAAIDKLQTLSEHDINAAVRRFDAFEPLEKIANTVLEKNSCDQATLSYLLGSKAEEFLPDEYYRKKSIRLYELSARCGQGDIKARASYRYSLLQIWANHCDLAMPYLTALSQSGQSPEFRPRALYWTATCGAQAGTSAGKAAAEQATEQLFASYPFSLHSLLLQKDHPERARSFLSVPDTIARYRSVVKPELNAPILAAEALINANELGWAKHVLASINQDADAAEPEFQIYLALLYNRVRDPISKFRTLTVAFRDHPETISRTSLALYYPKNKDVRPDVIRAAGVNELVVISLIRQESAFNKRARSPAGAMGLMQVMPRTARLVEHSRRHHNLFDPNNNVRIGSKYFSFLLKRYDGDTELALAAYNAGADHVDQWVKRYNVSRRALFLDLIPFRETRDYVASIARNYFWYSAIYSEPSDPDQHSLTAWELTPGIVDVFKTFGT
jgi:soluble lytic murein transglycosylase